MIPRQKNALPLLIPLLALALAGCAVFDRSTQTLPVPTATPPAGQVSPAISLADETLTPGILPSPTLGATATVTIHSVVSGETLWSIALQYGVSVEAIQRANNLASDLLTVGQTLIIPLEGAAAGEGHVVAAGETVESIAAAYSLTVEDLRRANYMYGDALLPGQWLAIPAQAPVPQPPYAFSLLAGDLSAAYPLTLGRGRFTLHYAPGTFAAQDPYTLAAMIEANAAHIESLFQAELPGTFDIYAAGTLFAEPDHHLRGRSLSVYRQTFFLHDGSGDATDQKYISTHEMTHLFAWNIFGQPASPLLSEGAAVYSGMSAISGLGTLPLPTFCAAYLGQGSLPAVSGGLSFSGHIYDLQNYFAAGCFVQYLVETYTPQSFGLVYHGGDFTGVYGKSLSALEAEWRAALALHPLPQGFDPQRLVDSVAAVEEAYRGFLPGFTASPRQLNAYYELDQARLRLMRADFESMDAHLAAFHQILGAP